MGDLSPYSSYTTLEGKGNWRIVPARTHPHVMVSMGELREEPLTDLILGGTAIIRMDQVSGWWLAGNGLEPIVPQPVAD